jgi:hypothetical protein
MLTQIKDTRRLCTPAELGIELPSTLKTLILGAQDEFSLESARYFWKLCSPWVKNLDVRGINDMRDSKRGYFYTVQVLDDHLRSLHVHNAYDGLISRFPNVFPDLEELHCTYPPMPRFGGRYKRLRVLTFHVSELQHKNLQSEDIILALARVAREISAGQFPALNQITIHGPEDDEIWSPKDVDLVELVKSSGLFEACERFHVKLRIHEYDTRPGWNDFFHRGWFFREYMVLSSKLDKFEC